MWGTSFCQQRRPFYLARSVLTLHEGVNAMNLSPREKVWVVAVAVVSAFCSSAVVGFWAGFVLGRFAAL